MCIFYSTPTEDLSWKKVYFPRERFGGYFYNCKNRKLFLESNSQMSSFNKILKINFFLRLFRAFKWYYSSPIPFLPFLLPFFSFLYISSFITYGKCNLLLVLLMATHDDNNSFFDILPSLHVISSLWCFNFPLSTINSSVFFFFLSFLHHFFLSFLPSFLSTTFFLSFLPPFFLSFLPPFFLSFLPHFFFPFYVLFSFLSTAFFLSFLPPFFFPFYRFFSLFFHLLFCWRFPLTDEWINGRRIINIPRLKIHDNVTLGWKMNPGTPDSTIN